MNSKNPTYQPEMSDVFNELKAFLGASQNDAIFYPKNVDSVLNEDNSDWNFTYKFSNGLSIGVDVALFSGGVNTERIETVDALSQVPSVQGGTNVVDMGYTPGKIIRINDNPEILNLVSSESVNVVATQEHRNSIISTAIIMQSLYGNGADRLTLSSKGLFTVDFLREFVKHIPIRIYGIKMYSDNPDSAFTQTFKLKELNPFVPVSSSTINIEQYVKPESGINTIVDIPYEFYIGEQTFMSIRIPANSKVEITLKASAAYSDAKALESLLSKANLLKALKNLV